MGRPSLLERSFFFFPSSSGLKYHIYSKDTKSVIQLTLLSGTLHGIQIRFSNCIFNISVYASQGPQTKHVQNPNSLIIHYENCFFSGILSVNGTTIYSPSSIHHPAPKAISSVHSLFISHFYYCNCLLIKHSVLYSHLFVPIF